MNNVDISVVILVKNGQRYLDSLLKAVFSQQIDAEFEVIVIDSGSTDGSLRILRNYPLRLYQIEASEFDHGLTRNSGILKARGKYVVLITQDAIPFNSHWMEKLVNNLESDERVAGVYSRQTPHRDSSALARLRGGRFLACGKERKISRIASPQDYDNLPPRQKYHLCNFDNVSSCIRKSVWGKIPFPKVDFAEDLEWSKAVLKSGYSIIYEPESVVYHSHDFSIKQWYKRCRVSYGRLYSLFGVNAVDNLFKLLTACIAFPAKDLYSLCRNEKCFASIFRSFYLVPFFSISCALGQYKGIKDFKRKSLS